MPQPMGTLDRVDGFADYDAAHPPHWTFMMAVKPDTLLHTRQPLT